MTKRGGASLGRLLSEPARPDVVRKSARAPWLVVLTVCIGAFMGQLDASIVNMAYPDLQHDFGASLGAVEWVALSYLLVLVGIIVAVGRLADMFGRKLLYTWGFAVFTLASVACALAPDLPVLVILRAVQAVGAAMLQANSVALIVVAMPRERLGRALGIQGASQALGLALGPSVGGVLVAAGGWRLVFWVNLPAGIIGVVLAWFLLPRTRELAARQSLDLVGLALMIASTGALLGALSLGAARSAPSWAVLVLVVIALAAAVGLWRHTLGLVRRGGTPLLPPALFARRDFRAGILAALIGYLVLFGVLFVMPLTMERSLGISLGRSGLVLSILPLLIGVCAPLAGIMVDSLGPMVPTVIGLALAGGGLIFAAAGGVHVAVVVIALVAIGVGMGMFTPANNTGVMSAAGRTGSAVAGGVLNMTRGIGTAAGVAVAGLVFRLGSTGHTADRGFAFAAVVLAVVCLLGIIPSVRRGSR